MNENKPEVQRMTDKQFAAHLETLKIIVEKSESKEEILKAIERIQQTIKKPQ